MRHALQCAVLSIASMLVPGDLRSEWLADWRSELWYVEQGIATLFCLGSFRDALWVRRNSLPIEKRARMRLMSPLRCLGFLGALAVLGMVIAMCLASTLNERTTLWHLRYRDLPGGCVVMLLLCLLLLPAMVATGRT